MGPAALPADRLRDVGKRVAGEVFREQGFPIRFQEQASGDSPRLDMTKALATTLRRMIGTRKQFALSSSKTAGPHPG